MSLILRLVAACASPPPSDAPGSATAETCVVPSDFGEHEFSAGEGGAYETIQAAIDAAGAAGGGTVLIAPGQFAESLTIGEEQPGIALVGTCTEGTIVQGSGGDSTVVTVALGRRDALSIESLTLGESGGRGLEVGRGNVTVTDVTVRGTDTAGVYVTGIGASVSATRLTVLDTTAKRKTDPSAGVWLDHNGHFDCTSCRFSGNRGYAIVATTNSTAELDATVLEETTAGADGGGYGAFVADSVVSIDRSIVNRSVLFGLYVMGSTGELRVTDTDVLDTENGKIGGMGLGATQGAYASVEGGTFSGNTGGHIVTEDAGTLVELRQLTLSGGLIAKNSNTTSGIQATQSSSVLATDVRVIGNQGSGVTVDSLATIDMTDCRVAGTEPGDRGEQGVGVDVGARGTVHLLRTTVSDNANYGVSAYGDDAVAVVEDSVISDQRDESGFDSAVLAQNGGSVTLRNATLTGNVGNTVTVLGKGAYAALTNSRIVDNLQDPVYGNARGIEVSDGGALDATDVIVDSAVSYGIFIIGGSDATLTRVSVVRTIAVPEEPTPAALVVATGAQVRAENLHISGNGGGGVIIQDAGTHFDVFGGEIVDTDLTPTATYGWGFGVSRGATATLTDVLIQGNKGLGALARKSGTNLSLTRVQILGTFDGEQMAVGLGVMAEDRATISGNAVVVEDTEGVGAFARNGAHLTCVDCRFSRNQLAGVAEDDSTISLLRTTIDDTQSDPSAGGGVGVLALGGTVLLDAVTVGPHPLAAVWLDHAENAQLSACDLSGSPGITLRPDLTLHGNALRAIGVRAWDGEGGLYGIHNTLHDATIAVLIDSGGIDMTDTVWASNAADVRVQACTGAESVSVDNGVGTRICEGFDIPVLPVSLSLYLPEAVASTK